MGMAQIGVPHQCLTLLAKAGVYAGNLADLPWAVLDSMVGEASGMGVVQVTLLRTLHERLQAGPVRGSRSGSRSSSRTGSGASSRSSNDERGGRHPHVPQPVAAVVQQQQVEGVQGCAVDPSAAGCTDDSLAYSPPSSGASGLTHVGADEPGRPVTFFMDDPGRRGRGWGCH